MLTKYYRLDRPGDVRELLKLSKKVHLLLALIYAVNELQATAGYEYAQVRRAKSPERQAIHVKSFEKLRDKRIVLYRKLTQYMSIYGLCARTAIGGRVRAVCRRLPARGAARPGGSLNYISQKGLFVFSGLYDEDQLLSIIVNEAMFTESV